LHQGKEKYSEKIAFAITMIHGVLTANPQSAISDVTMAVILLLGISPAWLLDIIGGFSL
jgi:hypothetical protein